MSDLPAQFLALTRQHSGPYFFWRSPEGEVLMAAGARWDSQPAQSQTWRSWAMGECTADPEMPVVALACFTPDAEISSEWKGFSPVQFYQPEVAMHVLDGAVRCWGMEQSDLLGHTGDETVPGDDPGGLTVHSWDEEAYRNRVERALVLLGQGKLSKVVLSRRNQVSLGRSFDLHDGLQAMLRQPHAFSICYSPDGERYFLSATPERLGRIVDGRFETMALAGTFPHATEAEPDAQQLLSNSKERTEHHYVVEMIRRAAESFANDIEVSEMQVLALPHVHHIMTGISGRMRSGYNLRHVIAALHPTPAVAGTPRQEAQAMIAVLEPFNRGLYAGCIGWFIGDRQGDTAVTIRSALVQDREAFVWAGAGIVSESNPDAEERETRAKLQTMLDILGA
jgi:isochorismate synthase